MVLCTQCGAIFNEQDIHECLIEDLVPIGFMKRKGEKVLTAIKK